MKISFLGPKKEEECFLVLDIGTEAVKILILKEENQKLIILGAAFEYFDRFGIFNGRDFEKEVIKKTVQKTFEEASCQIQKQKEWRVFLGLPANILRSRIIFQDFLRENPKEIITEKEKDKIYQQILKEAKKAISQKFATEAGILPEDIQFTDFKILETKIDGYEVPDILGYNGKNLDFKISATFSPKYNLENFIKIVEELGFKILKIIHPASKLKEVVKKNDAIFLDVGGEVTQVFLIKNRKLEQICEFGIGGRNFSQILSQSLGLDEERARVLKEKYSKRLLREETRKRIKEIFSDTTREWFSNLKSKLRIFKGLLPSSIFLFGGGSELPEIEEILSEEGWEEVKFLSLKQLKIEDKVNILNNPKYINSTLIFYGEEKNF